MRATECCPVPSARCSHAAASRTLSLCVAWRRVAEHLPSRYALLIVGAAGRGNAPHCTARARQEPARDDGPRSQGVHACPPSPARRQRRSGLSLTDFALSFRIRRHAARPGGRSAWPLAIRANPPRRQRLSRTGRRGVYCASVAVWRAVGLLATPPQHVAEPSGWPVAGERS